MYKRDYKNECDLVKILPSGAAFVSEKGYKKRYLFGLLISNNSWETTYTNNSEQDSKGAGFKVSR